MLSLFNDFIILPFQGIYSIFSNVFGLGTALIVFSVFISILTIPLMKWAQKQRLVELQYQSVLEPQIKEIKTNYKGQAKSDALSALYKRYSYNPLFAARQSMQALVQVPVLIIAYIALESYLPLKGSSFLCFKDLSVADNLLFGLPLLPFVMTIINMCTTYLSDFTKKEKTQGYLIAFAFLVILFFAPAALLIYWTSNNLINLLKTLFAKVNKGSKFNFVTLALATFTTLNPKYLILPLCIIIPALFLWTNNISFFGPDAIAFSIGILLAFAVIVFIISKLFFLVLDKVNFKAIKLLKNPLYILVCSYAFAFFGREIYFDHKNYLSYVGLVTFIVLLSIYYLGKKNYRFLFSFLLILFTLTSLQGLKNFEVDNQSLYEDQLSNVNKDDFTDIKLTNKPNFYFFLCESMQGPSTLKRVYNIDPSEYVNKLKADGFEVYDNIYANSYHTLGTLMTMMSLGRLVPKEALNPFLDADSADRYLVSGGKNNNLMKIFKNNGYTTKLYLDGSSYFGPFKGQYLDYYDGLNKNSFFSKVFYYVEPFKKICKPSFRDKIDSFLSKELSHYLTPADEDTVSIISSQKNEKTPFVVFRRLNKLFHAPMDGTYNYTMKKEWINSNEYQSNVISQLKEIDEFVSIIDKNDPNSVVILLADHGSWRLEGYPYWSVSREKDPSKFFYEFTKKDNETLRSTADDVFHVFAAVRLPNGLKLDPKFSSVNVFLKIFALLNPSQKETINKYILPNYSSFFLMSKDKINLVDGKLQDDNSWYYDPNKITSWTEIIKGETRAKNDIENINN